MFTLSLIKIGQLVQYEDITHSQTRVCMMVLTFLRNALEIHFLPVLTFAGVCVEIQIFADFLSFPAFYESEIPFYAFTDFLPILCLTHCFL
jgi:hypothetical protein